MVDDDLSLSDLSISDGVEIEEELILDNEPSTWTQQDGGGSPSVARHLANMTHSASTFKSRVPLIVEDNDVSARLSRLEGDTEARALDYASLAILGLEGNRLCYLMYQSAPKYVSWTHALETVSETVTATDDGIPYDPIEPQPDFGIDKSKWLSLTATTLRSVERRFNGDCLISKTPKHATDDIQQSDEKAVAKLDANLRIDPKVFVYYTHLNAPKQSLEEELENILLEHAEEASVIQDLVCTHFGQFISCKNTIADIRSSLRREETGDSLNSSATSVLLSAIDDAIYLAKMKKIAHSETLFDLHKKVGAAHRALVVLEKRRVLFTMPAILQLQYVLQLWEDMSRNVVSLRSMHGCDAPTNVLMKLTSACEAQVTQIEMRR